MEEYQTNEIVAQEDMTEQKEDEQFLQQDPSIQDQVMMDTGMIGYSEPKPIGGLYALFQDVLNQPNSTKVSNLDKAELGSVDMTTRDAMNIALIGTTFKHPTFATFFLNKAGIVTDSAMSKKGWFTELFVTSKKFAQRDTSSSVNLPSQQNNKKWSIFGNKPTIQAQ